MKKKKLKKANGRVPLKLVKGAKDLIDKLNGEQGLIDLNLRSGIGPIARAVRKVLPREGVSRDQIELAVIKAFEQRIRREISDLLFNDQGYFAYLGECTLHQYARARRRRKG